MTGSAWGRGSEVFPAPRSGGPSAVPRRAGARRSTPPCPSLPRPVSGEPVRLDTVPGQPALHLAPAAPMPPVLVGGGPSEAVLRRAVVHGDAWLPSALSADRVARVAARLRELAVERERPAPRIHLGVHAMPDDGVSTARRAAPLRELGGFFGLVSERVAETAVVGGWSRPPNVSPSTPKRASTSSSSAWTARTTPSGSPWPPKPAPCCEVRRVRGLSRGFRAGAAVPVRRVRRRRPTRR